MQLTKPGLNPIIFRGNESKKQPVRSVAKHIAIRAEDLWFDSRVGQIGYNVAKTSPQLRFFFGSVLPRRSAAEMGPGTHYTFQRNNASITKL